MLHGADIEVFIDFNVKFYTRCYGNVCFVRSCKHLVTFDGMCARVPYDRVNITAYNFSAVSPAL